MPSIPLPHTQIVRSHDLANLGMIIFSTFDFSAYESASRVRREFVRAPDDRAAGKLTKIGWCYSTLGEGPRSVPSERVLTPRAFSSALEGTLASASLKAQLDSYRS